MSAKILEFKPKGETNPIVRMVLQQQAEISCADDIPVKLDMSLEVRDVFESLAKVLELNTKYLYEHFSCGHKETQSLLKSYTRIVARLRLLTLE